MFTSGVPVLRPSDYAASCVIPAVDVFRSRKARRANESGCLDRCVQAHYRQAKRYFRMDNDFRDWNVLFVRRSRVQAVHPQTCERFLGATTTQQN